MNARARVAFPAALVSLIGLFFVFLARGKMPDPQYGLLAASLMMLASVLFAAGDLTNFVIGRRWLSGNGWFTFFAPKDNQFSYLAMPFYFIFFAFLIMAPVRKTSLFFPILPFLISFAWTVNYTRVLLTTLSVSRYLDSLVAVPRNDHAIADMEMFLQRYGPQNINTRGFLIALGLLFALPVCYIFLEGGGSVEKNAALFLWIALAAGYIVFGELANRVFVQYGLAHEKGFLEGVPQDDSLLEVQRTFACRMKNASIVLAVVIYPATFVILYTTLIY